MQTHFRHRDRTQRSWCASHMTAWPNTGDGGIPYGTDSRLVKRANHIFLRDNIRRTAWILRGLFRRPKLRCHRDISAFPDTGALS